MAILYSPESDFSKEMVKWEAQHTEYGPGLRPYTYQEYPKRLYKAGRTPAGVATIVAAVDVESDVQEANMLSRGFRQGQDKALELLHETDRSVATAAAERAYTDRTMSPQAQAEAARAEASTAEHLAEIPVAPIKRKGGRPRKVVSHAD